MNYRPLRCWGRTAAGSQIKQDIEIASRQGFPAGIFQYPVVAVRSQFQSLLGIVCEEQNGGGQIFGVLRFRENSCVRFIANQLPRSAVNRQKNRPGARHVIEYLIGVDSSKSRVIL